MSGQELLYFGLFLVFIISVLVFDLAIIGRKKHVISFKESLIWTGIWIAFALTFYIFILYHGEKFHGINNLSDLVKIRDKYAPGFMLDMSSFENSIALYRSNMGMEYLSGYFIEYTLSMDNIFVIMVILSAFAVEEKYYKQVLFWGILGAIILRFIFIFAGAALISRYSFVLLFFGAFLVYTGISIFLKRNEDEKIDTKDHWLVKFLSKHTMVYPSFVKGKFFVREDKTFFITPLFIVLIIVEFTDLIFAMDSIPAIFAITRDPFVVFFSNIFAIMGLRSLFFLLMRVVNIFHYLKIGISFLLVFVGVKLLLHTWLENIGFKPVYSLYVILGTILISILTSIIFPPKVKA